MHPPKRANDISGTRWYFHCTAKFARLAWRIGDGSLSTEHDPLANQTDFEAGGYNGIVYFTCYDLGR